MECPFHTSMMTKNKTVITGPLANYETNSYSIEGRPGFNREVDVGKGYKTIQRSCRILVGESPENLQDGIYVHDSGNIISCLV